MYPTLSPRPLSMPDDCLTNAVDRQIATVKRDILSFQVSYYHLHRVKFAFDLSISFVRHVLLFQEAHNNLKKQYGVLKFIVRLPYLIVFGLYELGKQLHFRQG